MPQSWTVAKSRRGFLAPLKNHISSILADIEKASGNNRGLALARWAELNGFLAESDKIQTGMANLPNFLLPIRNIAGRVIPDHYVLKYGTLRGYYQIDEFSRSCLAKLFRADTDKVLEDFAVLMMAPED